MDTGPDRAAVGAGPGVGEHGAHDGGGQHEPTVRPAATTEGEDEEEEEDGTNEQFFSPAKTLDGSSLTAATASPASPVAALRAARSSGPAAEPTVQIFLPKSATGGAAGTVPREVHDATLEQLRAEQQRSKDMAELLDEYERTIGRMMADAERTKHDADAHIAQLTRERDGATEDLRAVESSFADLHRRYEKLRGSIESFRRNEETLKQAALVAQQTAVGLEQRCEALRQHAEQKLNEANAEIERLRQAGLTEATVVSAKLKKAEMRIVSLERLVEEVRRAASWPRCEHAVTRGRTQRDKEKRELEAICDELIAKVDATAGARAQ